MIGLVLAASFLPLSHFLIASTSLRGHLVGRLGEQRYLSFYSGLTVAALACLIVAYLRAPAHVLWMMPGWTAALLVPVALVGSVLVAAGLSTPNPVIVRWCSHRQVCAAALALQHC
jgi:uncharacterized membrane protein